MSRESQLRENGKVRKDVDLHNEIISKLQSIADKKGWALKRLMENVLENRANLIKTRKNNNNDKQASTN